MYNQLVSRCLIATYSFSFIIHHVLGLEKGPAMPGYAYTFSKRIRSEFPLLMILWRYFSRCLNCFTFSCRVLL